MKINVLYVIWSLGLGGAEQVVIQLAKGLDRDRFQPFVCCLNDAGLFADELKGAGVKIFALQKKRGIDFSVIGKIIRIIRENDIHLVHTHLWGANVWGRIAGILASTPVVITEHNVDVWKKWHHKFIDRILANFTAKICVVSREVKKFYTTEIGLPDRKMEIIYNGISTDPPVSGADAIRRIKEESGIQDGIPVLANVGRLVPAKANHIFIEALKILDRENLPFHALMVGDGPLCQELTAQAGPLMKKNKISFTGLRKDMPAIWSITDICVLSSTREGFSMVILEAMAKGVPVAATDVGGNSEQILDGQTGLLVPENNPGALARALASLLRDPARRRVMGEAGRQHVREEFSLDAMIRKTGQIYQSLKPSTL